MNRQEKQLSIGVYFFNGDYRAFDGYPDMVDVWNSRLDYAPDYLASASSTSLSGVARANPSGYRPTLSIALDNSLRDQANKIRGILNKCANQFDRIVFPKTGTATVTSASTNNFTINSSDLLSQANAYNIAIARNATKQEEVLITGYSKSGDVGTFTVDGDVSDWDNDSLFIIAKPNLPSYLGVKRDGEERQFYTIEGGTFGIERELTIGSHIINLNLRGRERLNVIPTDAIL